MTNPYTFGQFKDKTHVLPIRIYYEDTDLTGIVYHANYVRFMERGRTEFLRTLEALQTLSLNESEKLVWTIHKIEIEYMHPARLDDLIEIHSKIVLMTGARIIFEQTVYHDGILLTRGSAEVCVMTLNGKLQRIPQKMRDTLQPFIAFK